MLAPLQDEPEERKKRKNLKAMLERRETALREREGKRRQIQRGKTSQDGGQDKDTQRELPQKR